MRGIYGKKTGCERISDAALVARANDAQRKRRPRLFFVPQLHFGEHGLLGEDVLGHVEFQIDAGKHDARKHAGNENPGEQAGENQKEKIVAGVDRGEHEDEDRGEIDGAVAREAVVNLIGEPAQAGALASAGTIATATHAAIPRAMTVVIAASRTRPSCAAAAEKSATTSAAESASMAMPKFRQPGRSRPCHQRWRVDSCVVMCA